MRRTSPIVALGCLLGALPARAAPAQNAELPLTAPAQVDEAERRRREENKKFELYHAIKTDAQGHIVPWYDPNPGKAFDHAVRILFKWWVNIENDPRDPKGIPYYMLHQCWRPGPDYDQRGVGGDQLAMALSSWNLLHAYTGDEAVKQNMVLIADLLLQNRTTGAKDEWPSLPYLYNTRRFTKDYDGIMRGGPGYVEPDKVGSIAYELLVLHKITGDRRYLDAAVRWATVLARKAREGDNEISPLPYRVRARDGAVASSYTTNWVSTLRLWKALAEMGKGDVAAYKRAHDLTVRWLKAYPAKTNKWGPFFEDVGNIYWSDTQINAVTLAMYVMDEREAWGPTWKEDARAMLDWADRTLGNDTWKKYGVRVMNEQTSYRVPGNSHTSRQASMELRWAELAGDGSRKPNAVRGLSWATYHIAADGRNRYYHDDIWLTDGYGDFVRHFLRAMAAAPEIAPDDQDHLLRTTSVVQSVSYAPGRIAYRTFHGGRDGAGEELLKVTTFKPARVTLGGKELPRLASREELAAATSNGGYTLGAPGDLPTVLRVRRLRAGEVAIAAAASAAE
jgi:hypothetical protein